MIKLASMKNHVTGEECPALLRMLDRMDPSFRE